MDCGSFIARDWYIVTWSWKMSWWDFRCPIMSSSYSMFHVCCFLIAIGAASWLNPVMVHLKSCFEWQNWISGLSKAKRPRMQISVHKPVVKAVLWEIVASTVRPLIFQSYHPLSLQLHPSSTAASYLFVANMTWCVEDEVGCSLRGSHWPVLSLLKVLLSQTQSL